MSHKTIGSRGGRLDLLARAQVVLDGGVLLRAGGAGQAPARISIRSTTVAAVLPIARGPASAILGVARAGNASSR